MNRLSSSGCSWKKCIMIGIVIAAFVALVSIAYAFIAASYRINSNNAAMIVGSAPQNTSSSSSLVPAWLTEQMALQFEAAQDSPGSPQKYIDQFGPMSTSGRWGFRAIQRVDDTHSKPDDAYNSFVGIYRDGKEIKEVPLDNWGAEDVFAVSPDEKYVAFVQEESAGGCLLGSIPGVIDLNTLSQTDITSPDASSIAKSLGLRYKTDPNVYIQSDDLQMDGPVAIQAPQDVTALKWVGSNEFEATTTFGIDDMCTLKDWSSRKGIPDTVTKEVMYSVPQ